MGTPTAPARSSSVSGELAPPCGTRAGPRWRDWLRRRACMCVPYRLSPMSCLSTGGASVCLSAIWESPGVSVTRSDEVQGYGMRVVEHFFHELPILTKSFYFRSSTRHARSPWTCRATKCRSWRREGTSVMCPTCDTIALSHPRLLTPPHLSRKSIKQEQ